MNSSPDVFTLLQQLLFQQSHHNGQYEDAVWAVNWLLRHLLSGFGLMVLSCACLAFLVVLVYRPRLTRGALWVPVFGLFGGTPTLYFHTRPSSFCGVFTPRHSGRRTRSRFFKSLRADLHASR